MPADLPPGAVPVIDGETLRARLASGERIWLLHASGSQRFRKVHIRGSVAFADIDQIRSVLRPDDEIVVYGGTGCEACRALVERLRRSGYGRACWYAGGLQDWLAGGGEVEGVGGSDDRPTPAAQQPEVAPSEQGRGGKGRDR
jgi:rhodanese-related sulfurtransferase